MWRLGYVREVGKEMGFLEIEIRMVFLDVKVLDVLVGVVFLYVVVCMKEYIIEKV